MLWVYNHRAGIDSESNIGPRVERVRMLSVVNMLFAQGQLVCFNANAEFTIIIYIHYKPRIAVAILDL